VLRLALSPGFATFGPGKRVAQIATTAFDAATYEIWCSLLNGATCVVIPREAAYEPEALAEAFARARVHSTFLTVSVFRRAVFAKADAFSGFEEVLFGGEAADSAVVTEARRRWPAVRFINGYGPTETTTFASYFPVEHLSEEIPGVPIGGPIRATALYVLDPYLEPVPRGVAGELWIGGEGLADGYVGAPGLTAERFVADPFSNREGTRMYRSGDRVCRQADGALVYLGRMDRQLKLRGYRIEPGEIEAALRTISGAEQVVVDVRTMADGEPVLYAWVVDSRLVEADELRGWRSALREQLPQWMVPRRIGVIDSLPLNPNGKLDRGALAIPEAGSAARVEREIHYGTKTEAELAKIWSTLLGGGRFAPGDGFFESGGHSLLGVRLVALIRECFGVDLPLRAIFDHATLCEMAASIDYLCSQGSENKGTPIQRRARRADTRTSGV
jgi:acyl-coenzyme A synthetase/AMP-(fatty) acid ligase